MAFRYTAEELVHLRQSTLCTKPPNLPPAEEWMGPPPEKAKPTNERARGDSFLPSQENRRPALDRNGSRNPNPEEIILGPPRTSFASATTQRNGRPSDEKGARDSDRQERSDRFNFRSRTNDPEPPNERFREGREGREGRDGRHNFRRRDDQDSDGWSTVKPRKSFGHEGAERFHGRMGAAGEPRFTNERRNREERDTTERRPRGFEGHPRDKEEDESEAPRRNGLNRNRADPWFKEGSEAPPASQRERIDRAKSWRDRDSDARANERHNERHNGRWDRERNERNERDPEWLDEPAEERAGGHTEEDFKKFMESMKASKAGTGKGEDRGPATAAVDSPASKGFFEMDPKVASAPAAEPGPDKFFAAFAGHDVKAPAVEAKEAPKPKSAKPSRFMALMTPQEDARMKAEPPTPAAIPGPSGPAIAGIQIPIPPPQSSEEKEAFAALIQKLQRQTLGVSLQAAAPPHQQHQPAHHPQANFPEPRAVSAQPQKSAIASPEPFQQYGGERREDPRFQQFQDNISPRPMGLPTQPPPVSRPEQVLHDLLAQRHQASSQAGNRMEQNAAAVSINQSQKDFLMGLMQRTEPLPRTTEAMVVDAHTAQAIASAQDQARRGAFRMGANNKQGVPTGVQDREQAQRQMRAQGPPGLFDDQFHPPEDRPQPTQILQRPPPPPGLDHHMHAFPMGGGAGNPPQMPPQRPMIPPPGLANNGPRNVPPMPGAMFPPNFPAGAFPPPPEALMMGPPRSMQPPPGFFGGGPPPPGFMPPPGMPGFQGGPEGAAFGGPPFDRRGMMPPGAGGNFNRQ